MATQSRILAWRILWIEESSGLQSVGSQNLTGLSVSPREGQLFHREHSVWRRGTDGDALQARNYSMCEPDILQAVLMVGVQVTLAGQCVQKLWCFEEPGTGFSLCCYLAV